MPRGIVPSVADWFTRRRVKAAQGTAAEPDANVARGVAGAAR
jgi:hypothetical protein